MDAFLKSCIVLLFVTLIGFGGFRVYIEHKLLPTPLTGVFAGYASVWGVVNAHNNVHTRGTFTQTIKDNALFEKNMHTDHTGIRLLWMHEGSLVVGKITRIEEDNYGLYIEGKINTSTHLGKELWSMLCNGDIDSVSVGEDETAMTYVKNKHKIVTERKLREISLVSIPADKYARVKPFNCEGK